MLNFIVFCRIVLYGIVLCCVLFRFIALFYMSSIVLRCIVMF